jgi:transglutaminase-like putative cysteine protease
MSQRHHIALVAAAATMLAALPIGSIFATWNWLFLVGITVAAICGTGMAVRAARGPVWVQAVGMSGALLLVLTWLFPSGSELFFLPTPATIANFASLINEAGTQIQQEAIPVPDLNGISFLTTAGIGLVAILVDLFAVGLRKPALAGLPMLAIYSVPVAVLPEGMSLLPFAFAAAGYLWLLVTDSVDRVRRFGRRFTGDGRDVDLWEPSPLASAGRRLAVVGVVVAMLLPLAVPWTSGILDRFLTGTGPGSGIGQGNGSAAEVDLFALLNSSLNRDKAFEMVRVTTNDEAPYYLRIGTADQVAPDGFRNRQASGGDTIGGGLPEVIIPQGEGVRTGNYHASVDIIDFDSRLAPVYLQPQSVKGLENAWSYDPFTDQIWSRRLSVSGKRYEFDYIRASYTPASLRAVGDGAELDPTLRALTYTPPVPQVEQTVAELTTGKTTEYDKVRAIYDSFSTERGFRYTLKPKSGTSGNAIVDFLAGKEGFCVQYAAAMAWLVRAAGYPARVAIGFTRGSAIDSRTYAMTNFNLHAWTEVYFPTIGWVPFDPTPPANVIGSVSTSWAPGPNDSTPGGQPVETDEPGNPTGSPGAGPTPRIRDDDGGGGLGGAFKGTTGRWTLAGGGVVLLGLLVLIMPALRRSSLRRGRRPRSAPGLMVEGDGQGPPRSGAYVLVVDATEIQAARRDAHAAWEELIDTMVDFDIEVDPAETPRATAERLTGLPAMPSTAGPQADLLASAEERARYARTPLRPDPLDAAVRGVRRAFLSRATRRERLSAALMPRSVLQRWRTDWLLGLSRIVTTTGLWRDRIVRALSPRRLLASRSK